MSTEPKSISVEFLIDKKHFLNSNAMPNHFIVKGAMVERLRSLGAETMLEHHSEDNRPSVEEKLQRLDHERGHALQKKRHKTKLKKKHPKASEADLNAMVTEDFEGEEPEPSSDVDIDYLYSQLRMIATIYPPTARRFDAPNAWPTIKALTDGMIDGGLAEDDSFEYITETSFRYGGKSGQTGVFRVVVDLIPETTDTSVSTICECSPRGQIFVGG